MLEDIIVMIRDASTSFPTPVGRINELLKQLLEECGLSPYNKGESQKITKLIRRTGLNIVNIEHRLDYEFGNAKMTYVYFSSWDENKKWNQAFFEYCWG